MAGPLDAKWSNCKAVKSKSQSGQTQVVKPEWSNPFFPGVQEEQWLDLSTRAVFIDFVVYSPNVDFVTQVPSTLIG